jgi:LPXTG-motif cell wall-anchored protein
MQSPGTDAIYTILGSALLVLGFIARRKRTHR